MEKLELAKAWSMIGICIGDLNSNLDKLRTWYVHPLGKNLALKLLKQFEELSDIQNLSLLATLILGFETKMF